MQLWEIIVLSLVQGMTEFLPVSSSGHLLAARYFLGISDVGGTTLDAFLHLGTLVAVLLYYWRVWWGITMAVFSTSDEGRDKRELMAKLAVATVPAAVVGYLFQDLVETHFRSLYWLAGSLLFTAVVLWVFDRSVTQPHSINRADFRDAAYIGLMQVLALIPGVSRSGMTIAAGRWRGLSRKQAATFSFLLSAPIIAGAGLSSLTSLLAGTALPGRYLLVGFIVSFLSGWLAITLLLRFIERISFKPFSLYLIGLSLLLLWYA